MTPRMLPIAALAFALPTPAARAAADCASPQTQTEMTVCAAAQAGAVDAALDAAYRQLLAKLQSATSRDRLRAAERAWRSFRDREYAFRTGAVEGGSAASMVMSECLAGLAQQRVKDLRALLACPEGDLSCPR